MKRSKGVTILGRLEVIAGLAGTAVLLYVFFGSFVSLFFSQGETRMGFLALFLSPALLPFPIMAISGIGILKLRPWAPIVHIILWSIALGIGAIILTNIILQHYSSIHKPLDIKALVLTAIFLLINLAVLIFINLPSTKKQCRQQ